MYPYLAMHHNQTSLLIHVAQGYHFISPLLFFREVATVWLAPDSAVLSHPHYIFTLRYPRTQWYTCAHISLTKLTLSLSLFLFLPLYVCVNIKAAINLWWVKIKCRQSACFILSPGHLHHLVRMTSSVFKRTSINMFNSTMNVWLIMLLSSTKIHISTAHYDCWYFGSMSTYQTDFFTWYQTANLFS